MADTKRASLDIGALSSISGVNMSTIRTWENRYRVLSPGKTETGRRLYGQDDVDRLVLIKNLVERGHKISNLGDLSTANLLELLQKTPALLRVEAGGTLFDGLVAAIDADDVEKFRRWLAFSVSELSPQVAVKDLFLPILRYIGDQWHAGKLDVSQEHMLSEVIRTQLLSLISALKMTEAGPRVAFATLSGEAHEFGALIACYLASSRQFRTVYFGSNLPPDDLAAGAKRMAVDLIVVSSIFVSDANLAELQVLSSLVDGRIPIWLGCPPGRISTATVLPSGVEVIADLAIFEARLNAFNLLR